MADKEIVNIVGKLVDGTDEAFRDGDSDKGHWEIFKLSILSKNKEGKKITRTVSSFNKSYSEFDGKYVKVEAEKKVDGTYTNYNVKGMTEMSTEEVKTQADKKDTSQSNKSSSSSESEGESEKMSKWEWREKDKKSSRAMCLSYAKDIAVAHLGTTKKEMNSGQILAIAENFFEYVWGEDVPHIDKPQKKPETNKDNSDDGFEEISTEEEIVV